MSKKLSASEAASLVEEFHAKNESVSHHLMDIVFDAIRVAATRGDRQTDDPFCGLRMPRPNDRQLGKVAEQLIALGFEVTLFDTMPPLLKISW